MLLVLLVGSVLFWRLSRLAVRPRAERKTTGQLGLQRVAVTLQLAVSIQFIVAAWVVMLQMRFVNHKDLGFDRNGIVYLSGIQLFINEDVRVALLKELASIPQVGNVTDTYFTPKHSATPSDIKTDIE